MSLDVRCSVDRRVIRTPGRPAIRAHVLIVSTNRMRACHLRSVLLREHFSARVATPDSVIAVARACAAPHVVVMSMADPMFDGLALCRALCASHVESAIMMLHPQGTLDDLLDGYEAGADAYLLGFVDCRELFRRIEALSWPQALPPQPTVGDARASTHSPTWQGRHCRCGSRCMVPRQRSISRP